MATQTRTRKRSDQIRKRRRGRSKQPTRRGLRRRVLRSNVLPPMVARSGKLGNLRVPRKRSRNRRRFDIALGVPGAEIRLPAIPSVQFGWRSLSGILVVLLIGLLYTLSNSPTFHVSSAQVAGLHRLTSQEVNSVLRVAGMSIFSTDPRQAERDLQEAFPELYDIAVRASFPAEFIVTVRERQPVLAWEQNGLTLWVDESGVAFPPRGEADIQFTVAGLDAPQPGPGSNSEARIFMDPTWIPMIQTVGEHAPAGTTLLYEKRHGLGWMDSGGWQVFVGHGNAAIEEKMLVYRAIVKHLTDTGINPQMISVEYVDAPYYRLEQ